ncbi:MAG: ATP-binding protein [Erysipelotrichaceae bacterium]|nr:ATP-binding protein [Erysipelotrichaceae bacterium]
MKFKYNHNIMELFLKLLPVQIFMCIANGLSGIVNGLIIGNMLSKTAMAALGLTAPLTNFLGSLAQIVSGGSGILCGMYMGRGEAKKINQVFSNAMIVLLVAGSVLTCGCFVFATPLASLLGASAETLADTSAFIRGTALGILPMLVIPCMMTFLQMCNKSSISLAATILLAIFNTVFCLGNIKLMGASVFGVGLATSFSRIATAAFLIIYLFIKKDLVTFDAKSFDTGMSKEMVVLGSPGSLAGILYSIRNVFINNYAAQIGGTTAVNALAILGSCGCFFDAINIGVGSTLSMLASVFVGERDSRSLKELMRITAFIGVLLGGVKLVIAYAFGGTIARIFGAEGDVIDATYRLLTLYNWSGPLNIFTQIFMGVYQSLGRVVFCNLLYPVNCIVTPFICCAFISKIIGIDAIWGCYAIAECVTLSVMFIIACIKKKGLVRSFEDMLYLDSNFDTKNKYSISIKDIEGVVSVSRGVEDFCKNNNIDNRRSMLAGLCMEEMASNVVEHGFKKDKKKDHSIDIFACVENDEVLLRLRDNCVKFDPHTKLEMYSNDDPTKNVGIKMVSKIAKEMNYQTTFGMNVLNIKL